MELLQQLETDDSIKQILIENLRLVVYISRKGKFENTGIDIGRSNIYRYNNRTYKSSKYF